MSGEFSAGGEQELKPYFTHFIHTNAIGSQCLYALELDKPILSALYQFIHMLIRLIQVWGAFEQ